MVQLDFLIKCKFTDKITKNFKVTTTEHETPRMGHPSEPRSLESHVEPTVLLTLLSAASTSPRCWPSLRPPLFIYLFILAVPCGMQGLSSQARDQTQRGKALVTGPTGNSPRPSIFIPATPGCWAESLRADLLLPPLPLPNPA